MKPNGISQPLALFIIIFAAILSHLAANVGIDLDKLELGALFNAFGPAALGVVAVVVFLLIDWIFPRARLVLTIVIAILLIMAGFMIRAQS